MHSTVRLHSQKELSLGRRHLKNIITEEQQETIKRVLSPFEPGYIGEIGSFAHSEETSESDLDILVRFGKPLTLLDLVGLELELSDELGIKVDVVTENAQHPLIKEFVEKDLKKIV